MGDDRTRDMPTLESTIYTGFLLFFGALALLHATAAAQLWEFPYFTGSSS